MEELLKSLTFPVASQQLKCCGVASTPWNELSVDSGNFSNCGRTNRPGLSRFFWI